MKEINFERKGYLEVKEGSFNCYIAVLVLLSALMFLCGTVIFTSNVRNYILCAKCITGCLIIIAAIVVIPLLKSLSDQEKFRYIITAFKEKEVSKHSYREYEMWKVYSNEIVIDGKGHFNCNFDTGLEENCVYLENGLDSNEDYQFFLHSKTHFFKYSFYTKIYDRKEKKFLEAEDVVKFLQE